MKKLLISGAVVAFAVTSAFAQTTVTSEYYVVRDATTKKCTIVDKKPTTTTTTVVDNGMFKTKDRSRDWYEDHEGLHGKLNRASEQRRPSMGHQDPHLPPVDLSA